MKRAVRNLLASLVVGASVLVNPVRALPVPEKILDQDFKVLMFHENGRKLEENLKIEAFYDDEKKKLTFSYFSGAYNREDWDPIEQRSSLDERYTELSDGGTRIYLVHHEDVSVLKVEERAWIVKEDTSGKIHQGFVNLTSLENGHPYLNQMFYWAGKAWDVIMKQIGVKDLTKAFDEFEKEIKANEKQEPKDITAEINPDYSATRIIPYPIDWWDVATARTYDVYLETTLKKESPASLWLKIALGDPTYASGSGSKNKYGELEGIVINFTINKKIEIPAPVVEADDFLNFFPKADEEKKFNLIPSGFEVLGEIINGQISSKNPYLFDISFLRKYEPDADSKGVASYSIADENGEANDMGFYMEVYKLNTKRVPESFKTRAYQYSDLGYFGFVAGNIFACFDSFMNYKSGKLATKEQVLDYLNFIIDYKKRINASEVVMNKGDPKSIKEDFEKHPENLLKRINDPRSYGFKSVEEAIRYLFSPLNH
ncbi:MAG TPA: hypothetical protein VMC80_02435 [Patescibacteria group bacterium]|nr:hypothetical protein [Patescibacteria group bacterium]